jgi:RNA polymerase sigma factor (sigma-70 family)
MSQSLHAPAGPTAPVHPEASARAAFDATCRTESVDPGLVETLWRLHLGDGVRRGWPLGTLLADHEKWREFRDALAGDPIAAQGFHDRWARHVAASVEGRFPREEIEDLTACFFERAFRRLDASFRWQCPFGVYVHAMIVNLSRDAWAASQARRAREHPLADVAVMASDGTAGGARSSPESDYLARDRDLRLRRALDRLREGDRAVIVAMLVEGRDGASVARELGIRRQALYQRLHRAKRALRDLLD